MTVVPARVAGAMSINQPSQLALYVHPSLANRKAYNMNTPLLNQLERRIVFMGVFMYYIIIWVRFYLN